MKKFICILTLIGTILSPLVAQAIPVSWNKNVAGKIFPPFVTDFVGIGTSTPNYNLSVEGISTLGNQAIVGSITATSTTATSTFAGFITEQGVYLSPDNTATVCANGCDYFNIDTAVDNVAASSTIYIKNGVYSLGATGITVVGGKNLVILGQSLDGVQITYSGSGSAFTIGDATVTRGTYVGNFTIRGTSAGTRGLNLVNVRNSFFINIYSMGFSSVGNPGQAFRLDGTGGYTGDNAFYYLRCDFSDYCLNLSGTAVNANQFYGFTLRGSTRSVNVQNANGNSFFGGLVGSPSGIGFNFTSTGDENLISGTYMEANATGVNFNSGSQDNTVSVIDVESNVNLVVDNGIENNFSATGDNGFTYYNSGNFGIATSSPSHALTLNGNAYIAGNITATSTATSTFVGGLQSSYLNLTGSTATSTAASGINLTGGCFSVRNSCISGGSSSVTPTFTVSSTTAASTYRVVGPFSVVAGSKFLVLGKVGVDLNTGNATMRVKQSTFVASTTIDRSSSNATGSGSTVGLQAYWLSTTTQTVYFDITISVPDNIGGEIWQSLIAEQF